MSGVIPLAGGGEAFAARVLLARTAEQTLDVQYYIWQADKTGYLLLDELRAAAERGVRLLVDENGIAGLDAELCELDDLPNVQVRLFNPFTLRRPKPLSFAFDFFRLNRRMHNKSFTADGAASVVAGRNVGEIYFAFGRDVHYIDTDEMALGPAAADVSVAFDAFWDGASADPAELILPVAPDGLARLHTAIAAARAANLSDPYLAAIGSSPLMQTLMAGPEAVELTQVTVITADPANGLGQQGAGGLLIETLGAILTDAATGPTVSVDLISAHFVHGSYAKYRPALLAGGVGLGELRADPLISQQDQTLASLLAGYASSPHSKGLAIDGERVFIGSFNFDPRSARLNTEMGLLIESPTFAVAMTLAVNQMMSGAHMSCAFRGRRCWNGLPAMKAAHRWYNPPNPTRHGLVGPWSRSSEYCPWSG